MDGVSVRRKADTYTQNKLTETSMLRLEFEPTTPVFDRAKTVYALDRAATVLLTVATPNNNTELIFLFLVRFL
jgi:hypothetical protein